MINWVGLLHFVIVMMLLNILSIIWNIDELQERVKSLEVKHTVKED